MPSSLDRRQFDAIVIGAGQAGPPLVGRLTASGMTVALVERHLIGGTCVNTGCTPTKALVASASAARVARRGAEYGVGIGGPITVDLAAVKSRKDAIVAHSRGSNETWLESMERLTLIRGHARFEDARTISIGEERLTAPRIFINVGGRALVPDLPGVHTIDYLTNTTLLELTSLPKHLAIIGGSYIGLEFAQIFRRFGATVTVIEQRPRLVSREDPEVSAAIQQFLEAEGIAIRTDAKCIRFEPRANGVAVGVDCTAGAPEIVASHVLLAVGRRPNTDDLGLEAAGILTDEHGFIRVDNTLETSAPGVWALGDCNGRGAFTHTAYNDFEIVAANLLDGGRRRVSDRILGYALFTDPPLGRVGLSETEARARHAHVRVGKRPMTRVGRAVEKGETNGFMKIVVDGDTQKILGAAILGVGGDEAIHGVLDMMNAGVPFTRLRDAVPIHPTVSELIPTLLGELTP
jgi:pyruvate/2-oxoglutarate dehydrogenase complex dihydrolipoamide dehydrogenase (E3) component